jgi:hypothetical protein
MASWDQQTIPGAPRLIVVAIPFWELTKRLIVVETISSGSATGYIGRRDM